MKKRFIMSLISLLTVCSFIFNLAGCNVRLSAVDMMADVKPNVINSEAITEAEAEKSATFAVRLFKAANESGKNTLISPLSVFAALAMTVNGARGDTLRCMEATLGMKAEELNKYFYSYRQSLRDDNGCILRLADSVWFRDDERFNVNGDFLQSNADYYGADMYKAAFDGSTIKDINKWVSNKTDGMISDILNDIPVEALMYLINALAFEGEWETVYKKVQVNNGVFKCEDNTEQTVKYMYGSESVYLDDGRATGFIKPYKGGKFAFAALLPNEGISLDDYIDSLDGSTLQNTFRGAETTGVETSIPKFKAEYSSELSVVLRGMGMGLAFDKELADFTGIGKSTGGNIFISRVIHKTFISVYEKGTKAGAATVIEMSDKMAAPPEMKQVYLDRPFVYMLVDTETYLPFFIGTYRGEQIESVN